MKIALVSDKFSIGGGLEHMNQITHYLSDFTFGIFAKRGDAVDKFTDRPNVQLFPEGYSLKYLRSFKPDLIHIHHLKPLLAVYKNPLLKPDAPVLYTLHGAHIRKYSFKKGVFHLPVYFTRYQLEKYLFHRVNRLITVSQSDFHLMKKLYGLQNVIHIPNGINIQKLRDSAQGNREEIRRKYHIPENTLLFLTVARFDYVKGHDVLMRAILSIKDHLKNHTVQFVLVGEGNRFAQIQEFVKANSLENLVTFIPKLHPVNEIMSASDVFILPSRWEGMPLVLLEAGYFKLPVIVSSADVHLEIIEDGRNGIIFRNQDLEHLAKIIMKVVNGQYDMPQLATSLYQDVVNKYDLAQSMEKLRKTYLEIVDEYF